MEYTFVMIRPGAIRRNKVDYIFNRITESGLNIECWEYKTLTPEFIYDHYSHLLDGSIPRDVFDRTMTENLSGQVIGMIVTGENSVARMRKLIGPGNVKRAIEEFPNSIRALGDPNNNPDNLVHASDSVEAAIEEIKRFFDIDITDTKQAQNQIKSKRFKQKKER